MRKSVFRSVFLFGLLFILAPAAVFGQSIDELCRAFINDAFADIGRNCANLAANESCYGFGNFGEVAATFYVDGETQVVRSDIFDEPAERVSLIDIDVLETLESIRTDAFFLDRNNDDVDDNRWGVALQEIRGNLPRQLPQNTAVYMLFGGTRIENAVFPQDALLLPETPVTVTTNGAVPIFGSPVGLGYRVPSDVITSVEGDFEADGISPDGEWVRVFELYERDFGQRATAWLQVDDLTVADGIDTLPVIGPNTTSPMQSLFLSNTFNNPLCNEVPPPGLLIQGPEEIETDFFINNVPMRVTSTTFVEHISPFRIRVTTVNGFTILFPDSEKEEVIPSGLSRVLCLTPEQDLGIDGLENDREYDEDCPESGLSDASIEDLQGVNRISSNLLNYDISPIPRRVCASGIGGPVCIITLSPPTAERIRETCEADLIPPSTCERYGF